MSPDQMEEFRQQMLTNARIPESEPPVRSSAWLAANLKSRNGDTLKDLNERHAAVTARLTEAREQLKIAEETILAPLRDVVERLDNDRMNIGCRLNIWWNENRKEYEAANDEVSDRADKDGRS